MTLPLRSPEILLQYAAPVHLSQEFARSGHPEGFYCCACKFQIRQWYPPVQSVKKQKLDPHPSGFAANHHGRHHIKPFQKLSSMGGAKLKTCVSDVKYRGDICVWRTFLLEHFSLDLVAHRCSVKNRYLHMTTLTFSTDKTNYLVKAFFVVFSMIYGTGLKRYSIICLICTGVFLLSELICRKHF